MNTITWIMALAVALTLAGARGQAEGELGRSVADARLLYETFGRYPSFRIPPGNVRAEDYWALFGNTVMVIDVTGAKGIAPGALKVVFIGKDGRYLWCNPAKEGRYSYFEHIWWPVKKNRDGVCGRYSQPASGKTRAGSARFMTPRPATRSGIRPGADAGEPGI